MTPSTSGSNSETPTLLRQAINAVAEACRIANAVQKNLEQVRRIAKDDRSPVTVADFAVQAIVHHALALQNPKVKIVGEEHAGQLREPDERPVLEAVVEAVQGYRETLTEEEIIAAIDGCDHDATGEAYWTLDPVDGTKGFLRGQHYAIALARIENGQVTLGVMGCPNLSRKLDHPLDTPDVTGTIFAASLEGGSWILPANEPDAEPDRVRITPAAERGDRVRICESVEAAHSRQSDTERVLESLGVSPDPVRLDSQSKYAVVARGQADAYLRMPTSRSYVEKIWDHAAGMIIAQEAGATVTDITGSPLDFSRGATLEGNRGIICAVPDLHGRLIEAIDQLGLAAGAR